MSEEIWRDIPGYEGKYQASTEGRIRSLDRIVKSKNWYTNEWFDRHIKGQILKPGIFCKSGHVSVVLGHGAAGSPVHQLVMRTFVGETPPGKEILHNDGNPRNNALSNLRFGTRTDNILDVYRQGNKWRKLSVDDVEAIRFGLCCGIRGKELAAMFCVSEALISKIKRKEIYSWLK